MSNLSAILKQKPLKKLMTKGASRKNSQLSAKHSCSQAIQKNKATQPSTFSRQSVLELLPTRARGRPTKMDKDLRQALKSKKFTYASQPEEVKQYIEKLRGKHKSKMRRMDKDKRKQSELSQTMDVQSARSRLLSSSTCQMGVQNPHSASKKVEALDTNIWSAETRPVDSVSTRPVDSVSTRQGTSKAPPLEEDKQERKLSLKEQDETTGEAVEEVSEHTDDQAYEDRHRRANHQGTENLVFRIPF